MKLSVIAGKKTAGCVFILALAIMVPLYGSDWVFSGFTPGGHRGQVNALIVSTDSILSAGEDGFLETWNAGGNAQAVERFQVSPDSIIAMAGRPDRDELCLVENDGLGLCRVSAWNFKERRNIFTLPMRDPITHVAYSMGGKFIIAARSNRNGLIFIDSNTGALLQSPQTLSGNVRLAVTGRSERNMLVYFSSGALSYWDLESGDETNRIDAPPNLRCPVFFGNNRYLAGLDSKGLVILNAVSGQLLVRDDSVFSDTLLCSTENDVFCLTQDRDVEPVLIRYTVDRTGKFDNPVFSSVSSGGNSRFTAIAANGDSVILGSSEGYIVLANMNNQSHAAGFREQIRIIDADVSDSTIAFITGSDSMGSIPLDYTRFFSGFTISAEQNISGFNHITAFTGQNEAQFILWQDKNTRTLPLIRSFGSGSAGQILDNISFRSPIRQAESFDGKVLFLDSTGNLFVTAPFSADRNQPFTFFSVGLMDAAFIDNSRLIIGRSAVSGNTPFMMINVDTGETVPLPYPGQAVLSLHRGVSGSIYAMAISPHDADAIKTSILLLDPSNIANSVNLLDFKGEGAQSPLVESPGGTIGSIAAVIDGDEAAIYHAYSIQKLDRSSGLVLRLINGSQWLISLDRDGSICWHESSSGKILAVFRLYRDGWTLQTENRVLNGRLEMRE